jgi:hypothetical protein
MKITTANRLNLVINLDDFIIRIQYECSHDRIEYYSWTENSATEGIIPDWKSEIISVNDLKRRLDAFLKDFEVSAIDQYAIDIFFK